MKAEKDRSPKTQNLATNSDRLSDNDSNLSDVQASSGGVAVKRISKNIAQKTTKPLRSKKIHMDVDTNPALMKWFDRVAPEKRLRNIVQFRSYLEKRYQYPIAN